MLKWHKISLFLFFVRNVLNGNQSTSLSQSVLSIVEMPPHTLYIAQVNPSMG